MDFILLEVFSAVLLEKKFPSEKFISAVYKL